MNERPRGHGAANAATAAVVYCGCERAQGPTVAVPRAQVAAVAGSGAVGLIADAVRVRRGFAVRFEWTSCTAALAAGAASGVAARAAAGTGPAAGGDWESA
jgi:hypothetical protein